MEFRVDANEKQIDLLRQRYHDFANSMVAIKQTMDLFNKGLEETTKKAELCIERIRSIEQVAHDGEVRSNLILKILRWGLPPLIMLGFVAVGIEHDTIEHLFAQWSAVASAMK